MGTLLNMTEKHNVQPLILNGADRLMAAFDYTMRKQHYAGNLSQIILRLTQAISPNLLGNRLNEALIKNPLLTAAYTKKFFRPPQWETKPLTVTASDMIHVHETTEAGPDAHQITEEVFNTTMGLEEGPLLRLDLINHPDNAMTVVMTWPHTLMDSHGGEFLLTWLGGKDLPGMESWLEDRGAPQCYSRRVITQNGMHALFKGAENTLDQVEAFNIEKVKTLPPGNGAAQRPVLRYSAFTFSEEETKSIGQHASKKCGFLGTTDYFLSTSLVTLHELHKRKGCPSKNYVFTLPVDMRKKATSVPMVSNQESFLFYQFLPDSLTSLATAIEACKKQTSESMKFNRLVSTASLLQLIRFLPSFLYMLRLKMSTGGEIASLFFANTGSISKDLDFFLGSEVTSFIHVPSVTERPGIGLVFYQFRGQLCGTIVWSDQVLTRNDIREFKNDLRRVMLDPDANNPA